MRGKFGRICKGKKGRHKKIEITYKDNTFSSRDNTYKKY